MYVVGRKKNRIRHAFNKFLVQVRFKFKNVPYYMYHTLDKKSWLWAPCHYPVFSIVGSLRDREVACSPSDRQGSNFESCVWRAVSSHSSHHPQGVLLAQFSLCVHKSSLKPDSFHFILSLPGKPLFQGSFENHRETSNTAPINKALINGFQSDLDK